MTKTMTAKVTSPVTTAAAAAAATQPSGKKSPVPKQTATEKKSPKQTNSEQAAAVAAAATAAAVASAAAAAANATTASQTKPNHAGADDAQPPDLAAEASQSNLQDSLRRLKLSRSKSRAGPAARTAAAAVSAGPAAPEIEQKSPTPARAPLVPPNNREKTEKGARVAVTSKPAAAAAAAAAAPKPTASAAVKNTAASSSGIKGSAKASSVSSANKSAASKDRTEPVAPKAKASGDGDGGTVAKKSGAPAATTTKEKPKPKVATKVPKPAEAATATATAATPTPTDASASAVIAQSTPQADEGPAPPVSPARLSQLYTEVSFSLRGQQLKSEKSLKQARTSFGKLRAFFADLRRVAKTIQFPEEEVFQELLLRVAESTSGGPSSGFDDMAGSETVPMHNYKVLDRRSRLPSECGHKLDVEVSVDKAGAMLNAVHLMRELLRVKVEDANDLRMARSAVDNGALFFEGLSFYATKTATSELDLVSRECEIEAIDAPKK